MQKAIREEHLDGWLFCNFHHRDTLSDAILHIPSTASNSRFWVYAVPRDGSACKIVHAIESTILDALPGITTVYQSRAEFIAALETLAGRRWGVHVSDTLPSVSFLDAGSARTFAAAGLELASAAGLIQHFKGLLDAQGVASHEWAARQLYDLVALAWSMVKNAYTGNKSIYEGDVRALFLDEMHTRGLVTDHNPIVGAGVHSGNPHYDFSGTGAAFAEGDVIQFDLWAKENAENAIYADISWVGVFGREVPPPVAKAFANLVEARETAFRFIETELGAGRTLTGVDVDRTTRDCLTAFGYAAAIKHRTGHGIDTEVHGFGVNIDSVEFPDSRPILEGSCFSLEPGLYFADFGLRTEIDVYIAQKKPIVSGKNRQFALLTC
ncbi:MAG: aminopeptidase P family protein [Treponema sp.]|jgi:Xaa-Pro aminopeptidase|nr:aminopeptidase P family protein [Treponema sp.]